MALHKETIAIIDSFATGVEEGMATIQAQARKAGRATVTRAANRAGQEHVGLRDLPAKGLSGAAQLDALIAFHRAQNKAKASESTVKAA